MRRKHFIHRRVDSRSKSGVLFNSRQTVSKLFVLEGSPSVLPAYFEIRGEALSPNLRHYGVLGIVSDCEEFSTTYPRFN